MEYIELRVEQSAYELNYNKHSCHKSFKVLTRILATAQVENVDDMVDVLHFLRVGHTVR